MATISVQRRCQSSLWRDTKGKEIRNRENPSNKTLVGVMLLTFWQCYDIKNNQTNHNHRFRQSRRTGNHYSFRSRGMHIADCWTVKWKIKRQHEVTYYKQVHHLQWASEVKGFGRKQKEYWSLFSPNTTDIVFTLLLFPEMCTKSLVWLPILHKK